MASVGGLAAADYHAWTERQADALREERLADLDARRLAEEIDALGEADREEIRLRLGVLLTGLLRWAYEVDLRSRGWDVTIDRQRARIARLLSDSPSLASYPDDIVPEIYPQAKARAVLESGLFDDSFPEGCPFLLNEILDPDFLPDPFGDDAIRGENWWRR